MYRFEDLKPYVNNYEKWLAKIITYFVMHQWCIQAVMFEHCTFILDNVYYTYRYNYNHNIFIHRWSSNFPSYLLRFVNIYIIIYVDTIYISHNIMFTHLKYIYKYIQFIQIRTPRMPHWRPPFDSENLFLYLVLGINSKSPASFHTLFSMHYRRGYFQATGNLYHPNCKSYNYSVFCTNLKFMS